MKIIYNKLFTDIVGILDKNNETSSPIDSSYNKDLYWYDILWEIDESESNIDLYPFEWRVRVNIKDLDITKQDKPYCNKIRIDKFYLWNVSLFGFFSYSMFLWTTWLNRLKKQYPNKKFVILITYDDWCEEDDEWLYVRALEDIDFYNVYKGDSDPEKIDQPIFAMISD